MGVKKSSLMVLLLQAVQIFGVSPTHAGHSRSGGLKAQLMEYWHNLGTHLQLIIQLGLVFLLFYVLILWMRCRKNCS